MSTLIRSFVGIQTTKKELEKYPTEREQREAMDIYNSKAFNSSCRNILYFIGALIFAGLIQWVLHWFQTNR